MAGRARVGELGGHQLLFAKRQGKSPSAVVLAKLAEKRAKERNAKLIKIMDFLSKVRKSKKKFNKRVDLWRACADATQLKSSTVEDLINAQKVHIDDVCPLSKNMQNRGHN